MLQIQKSNTEEGLLRDCRKGKIKAQRILYDRLASKMLGVCARYISDREEAEHTMIGGMVKVFEKLDQYKGQGSFEGWVRRIMVNESLMYLRKHKTMNIEKGVEEAVGELDLQVLDDQLEANDLLKMVEELPVGYRTVFNLYAIEGYNHKEISDALGINENTSKSQLSRARKMLQRRLSSLTEFELKKVSSDGTRQ